MAAAAGEGRVPGVRFAVVADRPLAGAAGLSPSMVGASALERLLRP
ncbi:hypothetical protein [Streptomyces canus]|nr:hypothetical protein [Streptomyces canus]